MSAKPVICQLLHGMKVGGAEILAARIARQLRDRYEFHVLCLDWLGELGEELQSEGFDLEVMERKGRDWKLPFRLARRLRKHRTGLILAHQYTPFFYALACRMFYWGVPIVFLEHGRHIPDYPRRKRILFNRLMLRRRDRIVAVGEAVKQALITNEGLKPDRIQVIYNGVDLTPYQTPIDRNSVRAEIGVGEDDYVVVQVARLVSIKDHLTGLRAMKSIREKRGDVKLVIVGDGPERERIEQFIAEHSLADQVRLLGERSDVPRLLMSGDLFLLTSLNEGIPLTIIEAMAAGLPVVSTKAGGVGEVVKHEQTGLLAEVGASDELASHILRLTDDAIRSELSSRAKEQSLSFSESQMLDQYVNLFEEMLP